MSTATPVVNVPLAVLVRLRAQLSGFVMVGGAAEFDAAADVLPATPAAFVVPLAERAGAQQLMNVASQRITVAFAVVVVVRNLQDATGGRAAVELQDRRLAVRQALLGWAPDAALGATVTYSGGRLFQFEQQQLWWADEFAVDTFYRGEMR